jgi:hypothetical protein
MNENTIKHLELIQAIVSRMNTNSFHLKSLAVTLTTAIIAVSFTLNQLMMNLISFIPIMIFWFLDSYFLKQERMFRGLYNDIVKGEKSIKEFDMNIESYHAGCYSFKNAFYSKTLLRFYFPIILLSLLLAISKFLNV